MLTGAVEVFMKGLLAQICATEGWEIGAIEVMPDHIHLFISTPPTEAPTTVIRVLKSITAIATFEKFPLLKKRAFWGSGLWSKGYYVGTAGTVTAQTIQNYIAEQKTS